MTTAQAANLGLPPRYKLTPWQPQKSRFLPTLYKIPYFRNLSLFRMTDPIINIQDNVSEADTCRKYVLPNLKDENNWTVKQILEQQPSQQEKLLLSAELEGERKRRKLIIYFATHKTF